MNTDTMTSTKSIDLADGRTLAYAEYGVPDGVPVFYFHGAPGSRLDPQLGMEDAIREAGVRFIAADRPGSGLSTFQPDRKLTGWPSDVIQLADSLGIERFAALGYSGGGPFALACAAAPELRERLTAVGVLSTPAPLHLRGAMKGMKVSGIYFISARIHPKLTELVIKMVLSAPPDKVPSQEQMGLPDPDYRMLTEPGFYGKFLDCTFREASLQGPHGPAYEASLYSKPWGFEFQDIPVKVLMWHGDLDRNAPVAHAKYIARRVPDAHLTIFRGHGHVSILNRLGRVLQSLVEAHKAAIHEHSPVPGSS